MAMKTWLMLLLLAVGSLVALSLTVLTSATLLDARPGMTVTSQWAACVAGVALLLGAASMDHRRWSRLAWPLLGVTLVLLALVLVFGREINGARRWLWGVQPAELAKLALIVVLSLHGARNAASMGRVRTFLWGAFVLAGPLVALVLMEPDRGTGALLLALTLMLLLLAGASWWMVAGPAVLGAAALTTMIVVSPMARDRIEAWLHPEANPKAHFQVRRGLLAFGSGGVEGTGLGKGTMKFSVPEVRTDFILPAVGEELGLTFTLAVVTAYLVILWAGTSIALRAPDDFGRLMASGITFLIAMQAVINIGVVTSVFPNKGMPLPFVSRGGSNLIVLLTMVGILAAIARAADEEGEEPRGKTDAARPSRVRRRNPFGRDDEWVGAA
jgi:cell division protein FtsW